MRRFICAAMIAVCAAAYAADEINAQISFRVLDGYLEYQRNLNGTFTITNLNPVISGGSQTIGTNAVQIRMDDVATTGWAWFRNLSTNKYITLGTVDTSTTYIAVMKLKAGEYGLIRIGTTNLYGQAEADGTVLEKAIVSD